MANQEGQITSTILSQGVNNSFKSVAAVYLTHLHILPNNAYLIIKSEWSNIFILCLSSLLFCLQHLRSKVKWHCQPSVSTWWLSNKTKCYAEPLTRVWVVQLENILTRFPLVKTLCSLPFRSRPGGWEHGGWSVSFSGDASKPFCRVTATSIWAIIKVWEPSYSVNFFTRCWEKNKQTVFQLTKTVKNISDLNHIHEKNIAKNDCISVPLIFTY